ncbi:TPA: ead/Ea22-like family protein [Klebsiella pneumoniae]
MTDITELTAEKLEEIRQRYRPTLAPKCHICGVEMTIQRMSASRITYGCAGAIYDETGCHYAEGRSLADDHYAESRITVVDVSDPDVLAMVEALEKAQQHIARQEQILLNQDESLSIRRGELEAAHQRIAQLESRTVTPVTYSENADADYCRKWAWEQVKGEVSTEDWTTGDSITYFSFFCWGWDMRRQYNEQRPVTVKLPQRLQPGADGWDDWYVHSDDEGEYLKFDDVLAMLTAAGIKVEAE